MIGKGAICDVPTNLDLIFAAVNSDSRSRVFVPNTECARLWRCIPANSFSPSEVKALETDDRAIAVHYMTAWRPDLFKLLG